MSLVQDFYKNAKFAFLSAICNNCVCILSIQRISLCPKGGGNTYREDSFISGSLKIELYH